MDQDLLTLLEKTGFTQKEAAIYLALLELGKGTVTQISKITNLKRSITYVLLEGLIKRGYVNEIPDQIINTYHAIDPSFILGQLKTTTRNFAEMLPFLQTLHNKGKKRPKITYYENKKSIWDVYEKISQSHSGIFISSYERIEKHFPGACKHWSNQYAKKVIPMKGRHLVPDGKFNLEIAKDFQQKGQAVRILEEKFNMDISLYDNKIAITSLEDEPFIVLIESDELAKSMKTIFEIIWEKGKEIN